MKEGAPVGNGHLPPDRQDFRQSQEYIQGLQNQRNGEPPTYKPWNYAEGTHVIELTPGQFEDVIRSVPYRKETRPSKTDVLTNGRQT